MAISAHGKPLLPALTGLRTFAALAIFNVHFLPDLPVSDGPLQHYYQALREAGSSGVCMFFALSGFILAYSYEKLTPHRESAVKFWASRFSRIYPVYFLGILWFSPFFLIHRYSSEIFSEATIKAIIAFIPTVMLVQAWLHPRAAIAWNGPGWSLSVEAAFYLLFPFIAPRLRTLSRRGLLNLAGVAVAVSATLSGVIPLFSKWAYTDELVRFNPLFHLPTFLFGASLGYYFIQTRHQAEKGKYLSVVAMVAILGIALLSPSLPELMIHNSLFLPFFGMLFLDLARGGYGSRFLSSPVMVLLGESSYALYILQFSIALTFLFISNGMGARDYYADMKAMHSYSFASFAILLVIAYLISIFVFKMVESPLRIRLRCKIIDFFIPVSEGTDRIGSDGVPSPECPPIGFATTSELRTFPSGSS